MKTVHKTLIALVGSVAMVGLLSACAGNSTENPENPTAETAETSPINDTGGPSASDDDSNDRRDDDSDRRDDDSDDRNDDSDDSRDDDSEEDRDAPRDDSGNTIPTKTSGYTQEAEEDLKDENVSKEEIDELLSSGEFEEAEFDEGHWDLEAVGSDLSVNITSDGLVLSVDK